MKMNFGIGEDDFKTFFKQDNIFYVDKSLFIKEFIDIDSKVSLITRPRRFGKTLAMSMLKYYFDITENSKSLFKGLKIMEEDKKYLNKMNAYPVIFLSLKEVKSESREELLNSFKMYLSELYSRYSYLLESDKLEKHDKEKINMYISGDIDISYLKKSIWFLSKFLSKHFNKNVIILFDEYDAPFTSAYENNFYDEVKGTLSMFFESTFKGNQYLEKGVLTGVNELAKESIQSAANNIIVYSVLSKPFANYFGFTNDEVKCILEKYDMMDKYTDLKKMYDGYTFGDVKNIYNPWSTINYLKYGSLDSYWINSGNLNIIRNMIENASINIKEKVLILLKNESIIERINMQSTMNDVLRNEDNIWTLLLEAGYLKSVKRIDTLSNINELKLPNLEIKKYFESILIEWFKTNFEGLKLKNMLTLLLDKNFKEFEIKLKNFVLEIPSFNDTKNNESFYHAFFLGIMIYLVDTYIVRSNRESGLGLYDICLEPIKKYKPAFIIEFKSMKKISLRRAIEEGLKQIKSQNYEVDLISRGCTDITKIVVAFKGKNLSMKVF